MAGGFKAIDGIHGASMRERETDALKFNNAGRNGRSRGSVRGSCRVLGFGLRAVSA
jgi:hypothetical protein